MSLALSILKTEVVAVVAVVDLNLAGTGYGKSLGRSLMCFDFSHFYLLLFNEIYFGATPVADG